MKIPRMKYKFYSFIIEIFFELKTIRDNWRGNKLTVTKYGHKFNKK